MTNVSNIQDFGKLNIPFKSSPIKFRELSSKEKKMLSESMRERLRQASKNYAKIIFFQKCVLPIYKIIANTSLKFEKIFHKVLK